MRACRKFASAGTACLEVVVTKHGISREAVIALEAGKYAPPLKLAFRISHAFDVGVENVFQWKR